MSISIFVTYESVKQDAATVVYRTYRSSLLEYRRGNNYYSIRYDSIGPPQPGKPRIQTESNPTSIQPTVCFVPRMTFVELKSHIITTIDNDQVTPPPKGILAAR